MIFGGDVAIAPDDAFRFEGFPSCFLQVPLCINLEGAVTPNGELPAWGVCNSLGWIESFRNFRLAPIFLGNNHIHDVSDGVESTAKFLAERGLDVFGAGADATQAERAAYCQSRGTTYALLGFGWDVIGCKSAGVGVPGVNRLEGRRALKLLNNQLQGDTDRVVVIVHSNYEFERYPQPAHRQLARQMIDAGAYAVIFHHSHIVCPVEKYKERTIAYGLGNWAFSYGRFFGGKLRFPESSFHQIAVELADDGDFVHHVKFQPPGVVQYLSSERVDEPEFSLKPDFQGFSNEDYVDWFKVNRVKRMGLPIYIDAEDSVLNSLRDRWVGGRQILIDAAAKSGIKALRRNA